MCGIVGERSFTGRVDLARFERMRDVLAHRGPDGAGTWVGEDGAVALGHRRLALIDLSEAGRQPMANEDETLWLTFNGEIYNHLALRAELEAAGHRFRSATDSEVILHGYEQWGRDVLGRLKGMFAFALYDTRRRNFLLARDRFGIKPLYYRLAREGFLFASELKGIVENESVPRDLDLRAVVDYLLFRYVPSPRTIWKGIAKLPAAHLLEVDAEGRGRVERYWQMPFGDARPSTEEMVGRIDELLLRSVQEHTISDVPVGTFLSGGYDSSAVLDYADRAGYPTHAFSIGFEGWPQSEHLAARQVAEHFGTPITVQVLRPEELAVADRLPFYFDEPLADISVVPTFLVSRLASGTVKAVLAGDGGDELFGGYNRQNRYKRASREHPWRFRLANRAVPRRRSLGVRTYARGMSKGAFSRRQLRALLAPDLRSELPGDLDWLYTDNLRTDLSPLKSFQDLDTRTFLGELVLTKVDRASMAHSLEVRVPLLDHELHEYVMGLHEDCYHRPDQTKFALRENIKARMPADVLDRGKQGFTGPETFYASTDWYRSVLLPGRLLAEQLIERRAVEDLLAKGRHSRLWRLAVLELWYAYWGR